jgi:hypothetical protein
VLDEEEAFVFVDCFEEGDASDILLESEGLKRGEGWAVRANGRRRGLCLALLF